jgi:sugar lactone lactonase YvrE
MAFLRVSSVVLVLCLGTICLTNFAPPSAHSAEPANEAEAVRGQLAWAPQPVAPQQAETHSIRQVPLITKDVVFDRTTGKLYASLPSRAGAMGNAIARINPTTGQVEGSVFIGSEPGKLALSDDGHTLYASLDGAAAVRRYDIATQTPGTQFALGDNVSSEPLFAIDLAVAPGNPDLVAVSRTNRVTSSFEGVAVYDNGVRRPQTTLSNDTESTHIAFSTSASTLYGFSLRNGGLQKMSVSASGVSVVKHTPKSTPGGDFKFDNGFLYMPLGQVYDAETATLVGTFNLSSIIAGIGTTVEPDLSVGRVFFLTGEDAFRDDDIRTLTLRAFDRNTFLPVGTLEIPNVVGRLTSLVRWGANGLAFGSSGGQFYIIQTTLVPSNEPVPAPTPTPLPTVTPTPTPLPTPAPGELREVLISANDIVINPMTETIYASVPSSAGSGGNSIAPVDPVSGLVGQPVFVGSEPDKLAISDNGQFIYVGLDGDNAVRRFEVASHTPGIQFSLGGNQQAQFSAVDMAVAPGQSQTVAVVRGTSTNPTNGNGGVAIYDDGVQRPIVPSVFHHTDVIEYSASPLILYGHNNSTTEFGFRKIAAASCGVSVLSTKRSFLSLLAGPSNFKIEDGLAYATSGRVADPEAGTLVGTYPVSEVQPPFFFASAVLADSKAGRVYFFLRTTDVGNPIPHTMVVRAYDLHTFLEVGSLAVPDIVGIPTAVVRWGTNGFALRTSGDKVYLLQTSLIAAPLQPPPVPAPVPTPPTFILGGQVGSFNGPPLPTVTLRLSGAQSGTTTTNADGSFAFTGLPLCTDFTVTPEAPNYTFDPNSRTITPADQNNPNQAFAFFNAIPKTVGFAQPTRSISEAAGSVSIFVSRSGDISAPATVFYQTADGTASERSDYLAQIGTLRFAANEFAKQIPIFPTDDVRSEGNETFTLTLSSPTGALLFGSTLVITITDNDPTNGTNNPADDTQFFVRQHYQDFLNRDPDTAGLAFWMDQINSCGSDLACREVRRINVSAAFFLSIEFQQTGYLVYKTNQAAFNSSEGLQIREFLPDTQEIGRSFVFGQPGAEQLLETNKQSFFLRFVQRPAFLAPTAYPLTLTATEFVDKLNGNTLDPLNPGAGPALTPDQRQALIDQLALDATSPALRAQVLRSIAENAVFTQRQFNKAFVLMQYFGYLRRNPSDTPDTDFTGYNFWLAKLIEFNGNFVRAEMVKAFISSVEYRGRFAP